VTSDVGGIVARIKFRIVKAWAGMTCGNVAHHVECKRRRSRDRPRPQYLAKIAPGQACHKRRARGRCDDGVNPRNNQYRGYDDLDDRTHDQVVGEEIDDAVEEAR